MAKERQGLGLRSAARFTIHLVWEPFTRSNFIPLCDIIMSLGKKPDFHLAMSPAQAKEFYANFVESVRKSYKPEKVKGIIQLENSSVSSPVALVHSARWSFRRHDGSGNDKRWARYLAIGIENQ